MSTKQDLNGVRTAQDLERKYDFAALLGLKKNVEIQLKSLIKVENELNDFINSTLGNIDNLQEQIDGKITTWYYEGEPTLNNKPAVDWNTDALKSEHEGDLYYDKLTGYAYRFQIDNNTYIWQKIADQDIQSTLAIANAAKDTADSKRHVFISQPTIPYDSGDLWVTNNEIFICQVSRHTGSFNSNDWVNNLKYTDNTYAIAVEGELNTFINTTMPGIVDGLQEQIDGKITTWYYQGTPTLSNNPAVNWTTDDKKNEHIGDLYYDKSTGYAYRFQLENSTYSWQKIADKDIQTSLSMASTAQDTADSKRQVFISQPTVPYDEGDLWVNNNEIYICINSKSTGSFDSNDWTNNLKYTDDTYAGAIVDELSGTTTQILSGQIIREMANYTKFTDLATGGSTTIAGENITTGVIKSQNYASDVKGMKIDLSNGTIDTKNTKWDEYGNIKLNNGAEIISDKGLMSNLQFLAVGYQNGVANGIGWNFVGFSVDYMNEKNSKDFIEILADIPSNFTISKAYITLLHQPVYYTNIPAYGYSRALALYKANNDGYVKAEMNSGYYENPSSLVEISSAFGSTSGWTPSVPSSSSAKIETKQSIDIASQLSSGLNRLIIETKNNAPAYSATDSSNCAKQTGRLKAVLNVYGFIKI